MKSYWRLLLSASLSYVLAFFVVTTCHEFGHGLGALLVGQHPVVYGVQEQDASGSHATIAFIAAAGPLASLVLGVLFLEVERRSQLKNVWRQLLLWFGLMNLVTFFGYLATAPFPFFASGDIAGVIHALGWSEWTRFISFAIGFVGIVAIGRLALQRLLRLVDPKTPLRPQLFNAALLPWVVGSAVILLASLPWSYPSWPVAVVTAGVFTMLISFFARGKKAENGKTSGFIAPDASARGTAIVGLLLVVMIVLEQTVLRHGIRL